MSDKDQPARSTAWQTALTVLQEAKPPSIPAEAEVMTVVVEFPPGVPGTPMLALVDDEELERRKGRRFQR